MSPTKPQADTKHTPGPWEFDGPEHAIIVWSDPQHRVCFMTSDGPARANARLISASPDMHDALTPFADLDGEGDEDMPDDTPVTLKFGRTTIAVAFTLGDLRRARAAIAKAEGRA